MKNRSQYERDLFEGYVTIHEATETLAKRMPIKMIMTALLLEAMGYIEEFSELEQWEAVRTELLDFHSIIMSNDAHWSKLIDRD